MEPDIIEDIYEIKNKNFLEANFQLKEMNMEFSLPEPKNSGNQPLI